MTDSPLEKLTLDDGRTVDVFVSQEAGSTVPYEGEGDVTVVGRLATAESVLVMRRPDGSLFASKDSELAEASEGEQA